jgi:hypothetical protein
MAYVIPASIIVGLLSLTPMLFSKQEREKQLNNTSKCSVAIEVSHYFISLTLYLPTENFVKNMKASLKSKADTLKLSWQNNKEPFERFFKTIPLECRKHFVATLVNEMRQSLESYFEKDDFLMIILASFDPAPLVLDSVDENKSAADNSLLDKQVAVIAIMFENSYSIVNGYAAINVLNADNTSADLLDSSKDLAEVKVQENTSDKLDSQQSMRIMEFLQTLRGLAVVMFLHQFLARFPVDAQSDEFKFVFLYKMIGERAGKLVGGVRNALKVGVALVVAMLLLQYFGMFDGW